MYPGKWLTEQVGVKAPGVVEGVSETLFTVRAEAGSQYALTRHREEDDLLVGPLFGGIVVNRNTAGGDFAGLLGVGDVATADRECQ